MMDPTQLEATVDEPASNNMQKAVLFADVSGSTSLYEKLGDQRAFAAVNGCLDVLRHLTTAHNGHVVKTVGDEIMCVFPDADTAVQAACEMQLMISANPPATGVRVGIRIGFHFGPVLEHNGDIFGDTVNVAARMTEIAQEQQIITTGATVALLPAIMRTGTRTLSHLSVKGKIEDVEVCEVLWQDSEDMTIMARNTYSGRSAEPSLLLLHQGNQFVVNASHPYISIGRDAEAGIVIEDRRASRMHARIERRRDKFILVDLSSNGSYVTIKDESEIRLRREEVALRERGKISLGHPCKEDPTESIEFSILPSPG